VWGVVFLCRVGFVCVFLFWGVRWGSCVGGLGGFPPFARGRGGGGGGGAVTHAKRMKTKRTNHFNSSFKMLAIRTFQRQDL